MLQTYYDNRRPLEPFVGLPRDFLESPIQEDRFVRLLAKSDARQYALADNMPIPAARDRETYYSGRDLEYWLSGFLAVDQMAEASPSILDNNIRILDFGGSTGRVSRHLTQRNPNAEVWLTDINVNWISWLEQHFNRPLNFFQNRPYPALPVEDNYFDFICAFSVFTHLDTEEMPWLLELRRILKPQGKLYVTVLDDQVWEAIKKHSWKWLKDSLLRGKTDPVFEELLRAGSIPERYILKYSEVESYNLNAFLSRSWIDRRWGAFFSNVSFDFTPENAIQSVVVLEK